MSDTIDQIAEVIGHDAAMTLCQALGGVSWYIPHKAGGDHQIAKTIGYSAWRNLCVAFGGTRLNLPKGRARLRRRLAQELLEAGELSVRRIALQTGLTERSISRMRRNKTVKCQQLLPFVH